MSETCAGVCMAAHGVPVAEFYVPLYGASCALFYRVILA